MMDKAKHIEDFMNHSESWSMRDIDDGDVLRQHTSASAEADVIEIDDASAPEKAKQVAKQSADNEASARKKKRMMGLLAIGGITVVAVAAAIAMRPAKPNVADLGSLAPAAVPQALPSPTAPESVRDGVVHSQFSPQPAVPQPGAETVQQAGSPQSAPAGQEAVPGSAPQQDAGQPASAQASKEVGKPDPQPSKEEVAQQSAKDEAVQLRAELERARKENETLRARLQQQSQLTAQQQPKASAGPLFYGGDVLKIYDDGLVLRSESGTEVTVAVGEVMRKYGRLIKTDPGARTFTTNLGTFRARNA